MTLVKKGHAVITPGQVRALGKLSSENFQAVNKDNMDAGYSC